VLALVPATEEGSFDFARKQQVRAKSLIELVKEVEKLQRPSNEQFTALLQLMGSDSHQMYLQMGIDPDS
jgi:hypothetical protein